jgi:regulator of sirC expression with transglutaminase-like and TPR domain
MTHINFFLFFLGLVPSLGNLDHTEVNDQAPIYQEVKAVDVQSNDTKAQVLECDEFPNCTAS